MSIAENLDFQCDEEETFDELVLPARQIRDFVENLRISEANRIGLLLLVARSAIDCMLEGSREEMNLKLIEQLRKEDYNPGYRWFIGGIAAAVRQGPKQMHSARLTITHALEIAFERHPERRTASEEHEARMRRAMRASSDVE